MTRDELMSEMLDKLHKINPKSLVVIAVYDLELSLCTSASNVEGAAYVFLLGKALETEQDPDTNEVFQ